MIGTDFTCACVIELGNNYIGWKYDRINRLVLVRVRKEVPRLTRRILRDRMPAGVALDFTPESFSFTVDTN